MLTNLFKSIPLNEVQTQQERKHNYKLSIRNVWIRALTILLGAVIVLAIFERDKIRNNIEIYLLSFVFVAFAVIIVSLLDCYKIWKVYKRLEKICLNNQHIPERKENGKENINQVFKLTLDKAAVDDPLVYAKAGAQEIWNIITTVLKESDGRINANNVLLWTSGLSGIACQASIWEKAKQTGNAAQFVVVEAKSGRKFYMGDALNKPLLESKYSIWSLAAGIYTQLVPSKSLPDIEELVKNCVNMIGNEEYRIWGDVNPYNMASEYAKVWKSLEGKVKYSCSNPDQWSLLFGLVLQKALEMAYKVLSEDVNCLEMAMENAIFTAKLDIKDFL